MIQLRSLTLKNFLSVGAVTQHVDLNHTGVTLVLGENLDLGGAGSRNGVGKSTIFSALCYALYGQAMSAIKKDNLINTVNKKHMEVTVEFEKHGTTYRIERGRRPNFFRYKVNDQCVEGDGSDEAQGENRNTQAEIDQVLGMSCMMFKHIVCLNAYTEPFLLMSAGRQREIIEELLGITLLSHKADNLRELIRATRTEIENQEFRINTIRDSNQRILSTIRDLQTKTVQWQQRNQQQQQELRTAIEQLENLDVQQEIDAHNSNTRRAQLLMEQKQLQQLINHGDQQLHQLNQQLMQLTQQYVTVQSHECPMCGGAMHDVKQAEIEADLAHKITHVDEQISQVTHQTQQAQSVWNQVQQELQAHPAKQTVYDNLQLVYEHRHSVQQLHTELENMLNAVNPYQDQVTSLHDALQHISYDDINNLTQLQEHQEFLLRLLTNKDSFIRKRIIDQNLSYLNHRLMEYLNTLGINHVVKFQNDLSVDINYLGQDMDFAQLSRGESTRVILSLSWAFRDIWENMNTSLNFLGIDELVDVGLDTSGVERSLEILKGMGRDRGKSVLLISHRDELLPRCDRVLGVIKENGFTTIQTDWDSLQT